MLAYINRRIFDLSELPNFNKFNCDLKVRILNANKFRLESIFFPL